MALLNLRLLSVYQDVTKKHIVTGDARESFADILYTRVNGIMAHDLAFRIYKTEGEIQVTEVEKNMIIKVAEQFCTPAFIDAIKEQLK